MSELLETVTLEKILTTSAVVAVVIKIIWSALSWIQGKVRLLVSTKSQVFRIRMSREIAEFEAIAGLVKFYCIVVRYGTDQYIKDMASEQEKQDGRLQNKVRELSITGNDQEGVVLKLQFPLHKRIGTQFKCFAQVDDSSKLEQVRSVLDTWGQIELDKVSEFLSQHTNRLFFLVKGFGKIDSVEGFENNMCLPE